MYNIIKKHSNSNYDSNFERFVRNFIENETENFCAFNRDSTGLFDAPPSREEVHLICRLSLFQKAVLEGMIRSLTNMFYTVDQPFGMCDL